MHSFTQSCNIGHNRNVQCRPCEQATTEQLSALLVNWHKKTLPLPPFHTVLVLSSTEAERPLLSRLGRPTPGHFAKRRFRGRRAQPLSRESPGPTSPDLRGSSGPVPVRYLCTDLQTKGAALPQVPHLGVPGLGGDAAPDAGKRLGPRHPLAHSGHSHQQHVPRVEASGVRASRRAARPRSPPATAAARWLLERRVGLRPAHSARRPARCPARCSHLPGAGPRESKEKGGIPHRQHTPSCDEHFPFWTPRTWEGHSNSTEPL